jgi:exodeoxyribonuclease VII small subunit
MPKKTTTSFESLYADIEKAVDMLENQQGSISDHISLYQQAVNKVQEAMQILQEAEVQVKEISAQLHHSKDNEVNS